LDSLISVAVALVLIGAIVVPYYRRTRRKEHEARIRLRELQVTGLEAAGSMHPHFDALSCIGCGSCAAACPEGDVIAVIGGKAVLVHGSKCVGHGLCAEACPVGAITLVMASPGRSAWLPILSAQYETTLPNVFIAGELGGMGLIKNAIVQGTGVAEEIAKRRRPGAGVLDLVIIGAGPAGLATGLKAKEMGLRYCLLEQGDVGGTILQYPRRKIVMTSPVEIPLWGTLRLRETSKESMLQVWEKILEKTSLEVRTHEKVVDIQADGDSYRVVSSRGQYPARHIVLALGRRGTPRKLGVEGEGLEKVTYRLIDASSYQKCDVLVVGGGDSAVEAAVALALQGSNRVTLSYRQKEFTRIKSRNLAHLQEQSRKGTIGSLLESHVASIGAHSVVIETPGGRKELRNDAVIISIGGEMPFQFLERLGVAFHREAVKDSLEHDAPREEPAGRARDR
jgi:thioredoxin reductase (NADPH)